MRTIWFLRCLKAYQCRTGLISTTVLPSLRFPLGVFREVLLSGLADEAMYDDMLSR